MTIAILSALPQEQEGLVHALSDAQGTALDPFVELEAVGRGAGSGVVCERLRPCVVF